MADQPTVIPFVCEHCFKLTKIRRADDVWKYDSHTDDRTKEKCKMSDHRVTT